jgi:hypothetical protein
MNKMNADQIEIMRLKLELELEKALREKAELQLKLKEAERQIHEQEKYYRKREVDQQRRDRQREKEMRRAHRQLDKIEKKLEREQERKQEHKQKQKDEKDDEERKYRIKYEMIYFADYERFDLNKPQDKAKFNETKDVYDVGYNKDGSAYVIKDENKVSKKSEYHYQIISARPSQLDDKVLEFKQSLLDSIPILSDVVIVTVDPVVQRAQVPDNFREESKLFACCPIQRTILDCSLNDAVDEKWKDKCVIQYLVNRFEGKQKKFGAINEVKISMWVNEFRKERIAKSLLEQKCSFNPLLDGEFTEQELQDKIKSIPDEVITGITPLEIEFICKKLNVSHFAIDPFGNMFMKYIPPAEKNRGLSICYISDNEHLYPVSDTDKIKSISQKEGNILEKRKPRVIDEVVIVKTLQDSKGMEGNIFFAEEDDLTNFFQEAMKDKIYDKSKYETRGANMVIFDESEKRHLYICRDIEKILNISKAMGVQLKDDCLSIAKLASTLFEKVNETGVPKSCLNQMLLDKYMSNSFRGGVCESFYNLSSVEHLQLNGYDFNKFYTSFLLDKNMKLPILDMFSEYYEIEEMNSLDDIEFNVNNHYYIETTNMLPLRGNGIYTGEILQYAMEEKIEFTIKGVIEIEKSMDIQLFQNFIKEAFKLGNDIGKELTNPLTGLMSVWRRTHISQYYCNKLEEASFFMVEKGFDVVQLDNNKYSVYENKQALVYENNIPAHMAIIQRGWMEIHKLCKKVGMKTSQVGLPAYPIIRIATDSVIFGLNQGETLPVLETSNEIGGLKQLGLDEIKKKLSKAKPKAVGRNIMTEENYSWKKYKQDMNFSVVDTPWQDIDIKEQNWKNENWTSTVLDTILENNSFYISGGAGNGKTFLAKHIIQELEKDTDVKVYKGAFTNTASLNLDGETLHTIFKMYNGQTKANTFVFKAGDWLIVDEISMVPRSFFSTFQKLKQQGVRFMFIGDAEQIQPVGESSSFYVDNTFIMRYLCDSNRINLKLCKRFDERLYSALEQVKQNEYVGELFVQDDSEPKLGETHIVATNNTKRYINDVLMNEFSEDKKKTLKFSDIPINEKQQPLILCEGSPLCCIQGFRKVDIRNQQAFTLVKWDKDSCIVKNEKDVQFTISLTELKTHFTSGYALTAHRAQGKTCRGVVRVWDWNQPLKMINKRWLYTALSRATSFNNVFLSNKE